MYTKTKNIPILSIYEEQQPKKFPNKKQIPSFSSKLHPLFENKLPKNANKHLTNSNSLIIFDKHDKLKIDKIISINHRNKKPKNQNSLNTSSSNLLLFQKSLSNHHSNNTTLANKQQIYNYNSGIGKHNLQITNQNLLSFNCKSSNPSNNNSVVFSPFNNSHINTLNHILNTNTTKAKNFKTLSNSVYVNNKHHPSQIENYISDNRINVLLEELNLQLKDCSNYVDSVKITDKKFNIIKNSFFKFVQLLTNDKHKKFLLHIMDLISSVIKVKNEQIYELSTTNNSSIENMSHPHHHKKVPINQLYVKQIKKKNNKNSKDSEKNLLSRTVNLERKEEIESEENTNSNHIINTIEEMEQLQEIQFCDKVKLHKNKSMPNLNLPKLNFTYIINSYTNTRNKELKKVQQQQQPIKQYKYYQGLNGSSVITKKKD